MPTSPSLSPSLRLHGREETLRAVMVRALMRGGRARIAVEGVTGIGKTAFLQRVAERLVAAGRQTALLNAAHLVSEEAAIASIYVQLTSSPREREGLSRRVSERLRADLPGALRKVFAAIGADLVRVVTDKADNTVEVVKDLASGSEAASPNRSVASELEGLDRDNRRYFIAEFLGALVADGDSVAIAIDNCDGVDPTFVAFIRFLLHTNLDGVAIVLTHNTETGDNTNWDYILADVRASGGQVVPLPVLGLPAMSDWFEEQLGRRPTGTELEDLKQRTGGRPLEIEIAIEAMRRGHEAIQGDYLGYYETSRRSLSEAGYAIAELLAMVKEDARVSRDVLASAADELGVNGFSRGMDELGGSRLLAIDGEYVGLSHSLALRSWQATLTLPRRRQLAEAWFSAVRSYGAEQFAKPAAVGLIPTIAPLLVESAKNGAVAKIGEHLIDVGYVHAGLELIDAVWRKSAVNESEGAEVVQAALLTARTNLELGRYREVDEPLSRAALLSADKPNARLQVLLLQMKLALRRNNYSALASLAQQVSVSSHGDDDARVESELILNMAQRDVLDRGAISQSVGRLMSYRERVGPAVRNAIDRALARSLAKLGDNAGAHHHASRAVEESVRLGSIKYVGNAKLALAEVLRYAGSHDRAISAYGEATEIARAIGNRDSLLWSLLGEAAANLAASSIPRIEALLGELDALLAEPGYKHPLESAHASLLRRLAGLRAFSDDEILERYRELGIDWPGAVLRSGSPGFEATSPLQL